MGLAFKDLSDFAIVLLKLGVTSIISLIPIPSHTSLFINHIKNELLEKKKIKKKDIHN